MSIIDEMCKTANRWRSEGWHAKAEQMEWFVSRLNAATVLVAVPDGEPCDSWYCHQPYIYDGKLFNEYGIEIVSRIKSRTPSRAIVQPVRLVPLAEAEL